MSHVKAALQYNELNKGKKLRSGDTVPYVICEDGSNLPATQRAYHCDILKDNPELKIDFNYYLSQQLLPVVSRLCEPIDGTDPHSLAEFMGIESSSHLNRTLVEVETAFERGEHRFDSCKPLVFKCVDCAQELVIRNLFKKRDTSEQKENEERSLAKKKVELTFSRCPNCNIEFSITMVNRFGIQLRLLINQIINYFYQKWMICDDKICNHRTRYFTGRLTKTGPLCPKCKTGSLYPEVR